MNLPEDGVRTCKGYERVKTKLLALESTGTLFEAGVSIMDPADMSVGTESYTTHLWSPVLAVNA